MPRYNTGEIDELKAKLALIYWRDNNLNGISSVGLDTEYTSHNMSLDELSSLCNDEIISLCKHCNALKAKSTYKADVIINGVAYSLKSHRKALPALLNHTHRDGIINVCQRIGLDISRLDALVSSYWSQRKNGICREDVKYKGSVFENDEDAMTSLLEYFLFIGSARGDSEYPAQKLYALSNPFDFNNWTLRDSDDVAKEILQETTISIRSKGVPKTYSSTSKSKAHLNMRPWIEMHQGAFRGAIHIRG